MKFVINDQRVSMSKFLKVGGAALFLFAALLVIGYAAFGWVVMLLLGALHNSVWDAVPALGYGPSIIVAVALGLLSNALRRK